MNLSLNNKHAILCGSTDGIGKASALLMAQRGASLTLVARNQKKLDQTLSELSTDHGQVHFSLCADFNEPDQLKEKITRIKLIDEYKVDGDFVESQAFAYLAIRTYLKLPISFPETTGVDKPCTGGIIIKN